MFKKPTELDKIFEQNKELIQLEKMIELIPYEWQSIKSRFYFGLFFTAAGFLSVILSLNEISLIFSLISVIFIVSYFFSQFKWSKKNRELVKKYAKAFESIRLLTQTLEKTQQQQKLSLVKKKHLELIKND